MQMHPCPFRSHFHSEGSRNYDHEHSTHHHMHGHLHSELHRAKHTHKKAQPQVASIAPDIEQKASQELNFNSTNIYSSSASSGALGSGDLFGKSIAKSADDVANNLHTLGDCAHGTRLTLERMGVRLPPTVATEQGKIVKDSGLFDEVARSDVKLGDYGVRDWNALVVRAHHGVNKGDSFIVTKIGKHGELFGANDHHFPVPEDGARYRNLKFYRLKQETVNSILYPAPNDNII